MKSQIPAACSVSNALSRAVKSVEGASLRAEIDGAKHPPVHALELLHCGDVLGLRPFKWLRTSSRLDLHRDAEAQLTTCRLEIATTPVLPLFLEALEAGGAALP